MSKETVIPVSELTKAIHFINKKEDGEEETETLSAEEAGEKTPADDEELEKEARKKDSYDVCEQDINRRVKKGLPVEAIIYKNGKVAFTLENQMVTWKEIHKRLGASAVKVVARFNSGRNPVVTSQTKIFDEYKEFASETPKEIENTKIEKDTTMTDTLQIMAKAQAEAEERAERKASQTISLMKEMIAMNRPETKSDNSLEFMKMMMEMNEKAEARTQALIKEMNERQEKQLERIMNESTKSIERVMETVQTLAEREDKEPPMDAFKIQAMIDKAKKDGREEAERLADMIEAKAEKLASKNNPDKKEESILDKTISSFLPMAPTILGN